MSRIKGPAIEKKLANPAVVMDGCQRPCTILTYNPSMHNIPGPRSDLQGLNISVYYDTSMVTVKSQVLLYTLPEMLSAAGGTLGMYLGVSLYSIMNDVLNSFGAIHKFFRK